ncbi:MAG: hypothetical protein NTW86_18915 [Candidatus Sumerlaeota bacterium]|nr:hypothetical protein [Candidatus Sumerlaeota bacterium]
MNPASYNAADYARDVLVYGGGVALALIALFLFMKIMKASATRRVRNARAASMTFDDLERMRRTGLIYDEEYKLAKARIAERVVEESLPKVSQPAETALERALEELPQEPNPPRAAPPAAAPPKQAATPRKQAAAPATPSTAPATRPKPPAPEAPPAPPRPAAPMPPTVAPSPAAPKRAALSAPSAPFDLEKLRAAGQIDEAEYRRLKAYFERKQGGK